MKSLRMLLGAVCVLGLVVGYLSASRKRRPEKYFVDYVWVEDGKFHWRTYGKLGWQGDRTAHLALDANGEGNWIEIVDGHITLHVCSPSEILREAPQ